MPDELTGEMLVAKLAEWFPWARWTFAMQGRYRCVWATMQMGRVTIGGFVIDQSEATERVARSVSWENARNAAKVWAWKQINEAKKLRDYAASVE